jgi:hypothetical protein
LPFYIKCLALPLLAAGALEIPQVSVPVNVAGQTVTIGLSGSISESPDRSETGGFLLHLNAQLADFQAHLAPILKAELDRSDRCGERISVEEAVLLPAAPAAHLTAHLHVEKWVCFKAFGKENAKRLVGGKALVEMQLMPENTENGPHLNASIGRIEADGSLGELLNSGSLGNALRDKIRESILKSVRKATEPETLLPPPVRTYATIRTLAFSGTAALELDVDAVLRFPAGQAQSFIDELRGRK